MRALRWKISQTARNAKTAKKEQHKKLCRSTQTHCLRRTTELSDSRPAVITPVTLDHQSAPPKPLSLERRSGAAVRSSDLVRTSVHLPVLRRPRRGHSSSFGQGACDCPCLNTRGVKPTIVEKCAEWTTGGPRGGKLTSAKLAFGVTERTGIVRPVLSDFNSCGRHRSSFCVRLVLTPKLTDSHERRRELSI
jgi:hypothetical protein